MNIVSIAGTYTLAPLTNLAPSREAILAFEAELMKFPDQVEMPLKHYFSDGVYAREAFLQAGLIVVGKIHRHGHLNIISKGKVTVVTEFGRETLEAPLTFVSKPGTKRVVYAHKDTIWTTIHLNPSNCQDLTKLEEDIIAPSYDNLLRVVL